MDDILLVLYLYCCIIEGILHKPMLLTVLQCYANIIYLETLIFNGTRDCSYFEDSVLYNVLATAILNLGNYFLRHFPVSIKPRIHDLSSYFTFRIYDPSLERIDHHLNDILEKSYESFHSLGY